MCIRDSIKIEYQVDEIIAFGFSQGAGLISSLAVKNPKLFTSIAMLSGFLPTPAKYQLENANSERDLPNIFMFHGSKDEIISFERAKKDGEILSKHSKSFKFIQDDVGHKVSSTGIKELGNWIEQIY